jgi:hypothetical protein
MTFEINEHHKRWVKNAKTRYGRTQQYYLDLIRAQKGLCAFSGAPLLFDSTNGTPVANSRGCHPLYAALDHRAPGTDAQGHCIASYALNDVKGHLPHACFIALAETTAWRQLMDAWRSLASLKQSTRQDFYALLRN